MTATQRIYTAAAKVRAATKDSDIYSMDDERNYGSLLYEMSFKDAVDAGLLSDYEVLIVATSQSRLTTGMSDLVATVNRTGGKTQIVSKEDAVKLLGCWDALADPNPPESPRTALQASLPTATGKAISTRRSRSPTRSSSPKLSQAPRRSPRAMAGSRSGSVRRNGHDQTAPNVGSACRWQDPGDHQSRPARPPAR